MEVTGLSSSLQRMTAEAHRRVVVEYLRAVMQKRISFRSAEERKEGAEKMVREAEQLRFLFQKLATVSATLRGQHELILCLAPPTLSCGRKVRGHHYRGWCTLGIFPPPLSATQFSSEAGCHPLTGPLSQAGMCLAHLTLGPQSSQ